MIHWKKLLKEIPASVKIGENDYRVLWITEFPKDHRQLGESSFGEEKQIIININQPKKEAVHTFWHECIHALSFEYDADLTEKQVLALEKGLKDVIGIVQVFTKGSKSETIKAKRRYTTKVRRFSGKTKKTPNKN